MLGPRLVVAGTASGVGKTTVATGLLAALRRAGHRVAGAKVGPDFIDPGYHSLACGRPPRNLDPWLCGADAISGLAARAAAGADVLVIEGVMGLFDGAADGTLSSTADVARLLDAPVVLVVDASAVSRSVAAVVHGFQTYTVRATEAGDTVRATEAGDTVRATEAGDTVRATEAGDTVRATEAGDRSVRLAGVILNRVGSATHETLLREALAPLDVPVLGALHRDDRFTWRDRHLGLVPVAEHRAEVEGALATLATAIAEAVDLDAVVRLAASAPARATEPVRLPPPAAGPPVRIAVAAGQAFTFTYTDTVEALEAAGAEVVPFDPRTEPALPPAIHGLVAGGGFPEVYAAELAANRPLLDDVQARIGAGLSTWAECGGLLWLARTLDGHAMAGVLAADGVLSDRLTLGYRVATAKHDTPVGPARTVLRGHEFHYSRLEPPGEALTLSSRWSTRREGFATPTLLATYLHHHPGGDPAAVGRFVDTCRRQLHGAGGRPAT